MQLPREARWSRSTSILLSVLVHLALFVALRHIIWKPAAKEGPVFHIFQLSQQPAPPEPLPPLPVVVLPRPVVPPVVAEITPPQEKPERETTPPREAAPELVQPSGVPNVIPPPGADFPDPTPTTPVPPLTAAERLLRTGLPPQLRPQPFSPNAIPRELTPAEKANARLYAGMKEYNDSVAAAADAARRGTDWTKTDKNGGRWGLAPDGIHIGSVTIPLPNFGFSGPTGRREEIGAKVRSYAEANAQAKRVELEETFESRVKAMRARKDAERRNAQRDTAKAGKTGN